MKDNELDKLFKSKLKSREFEFNPSNWEAMEAMLDKDRKGLGFYWWSSAAVLLFGVFVGAALWLRPAPVTDIVKQNPSVDHTEEVSPETQIPNGTDTKPVPGSGKKSQPDGAHRMAEDTPDPSSSLKNSANTDSPVEQGLPVGKGEVTSASKAFNAQGASDQWASSKQDKPARATLQSVTYAKKRWVSLPLNTEVPVSPGELGIQGNPATFSDLNRIDPAALVKFESTHEIWGQAGPDFTQSFKDGKVATGWIIGMNYTYRFAQRWSFEAGLNYNARAATGITLSSDSVFYNFGQELIRTEIRHQRLDYIEVPLSVSFSINPQHQLSTGIYTAALFNVNREIQRTRVPFKGDTETTTEKENGLSDNFNTMDYGLTGSYFYRYSPQISIGLQFKYGLTDITPDRSDALSPFHRNSNTRIIIRYRLY